MDSPELLWSKVLDKVRNDLNDQAFASWFEPISCLEASEEKLVLAAPDPFSIDWIRDHYQDLILSAVLSVTGLAERPDLQFKVVPVAKEPVKAVEDPSSFTSLSNSFAPQPPSTPISSLNQNYSFENFVVGSGNRFAQAAAFAVAESPAKRYNPLFLYGSVGLGKTHLMQAVAHQMLKKNPSSKVLYVSSEKFVNQLVQSIQNRTEVAFRNKYRNLDILLIDDVQFIAGKEATQEEFFHTFNALHDDHKQIVISSDRPPKDILGLEERLVSRFQWGLVVDIQPPDLETRIAILRKKITGESAPVSDEVINFIAGKIKSNIRELEGALLRVIAFSSLTGSPITLHSAQDILKDSLLEETKKITIDLIQKKTAEFYDISISDMRVKRRSKTIAFPRQVAMYLVRELTDHSLPEIGQYFGGRDHTTVLHAYNKVLKEIEENSVVKKGVEQIKKSLSQL